MSVYKKTLIAILVIASILRVYGLSRGDTITDEAIIAFRAVGMLDFDEAEDQTTPLEWFDPDIPWWTHLSFHDHPPLVFFLQHISMRIFGETNFGFRFPSALFGIASVYVLYIIGRELASERAGLIAASILALTANHVHISRMGLQESAVIFFILLTSYFYVRSVNKEKNLIYGGIIFGMSILAKYTAGIIALPVFIFLLVKNSSVFKNKKFWLGILFAILISSPVIVYNFELYNAVGHFDFQMSYIFGQKPDVWKIAPGKNIGTIAERISNFFPWILQSNSWLFLGIFIASLMYLATNFKKHKKEIFFPLLLLGSLLLLLAFIGPAFRFLTMLTPAFALVIAIAAAEFQSPKKFITAGIITIFAVFEFVYSINSQILYFPKGPKILMHSFGLRRDNHNWGYNELAKYIESELSGKTPGIVFKMRYNFLNKLHEKAIAENIHKSLRPYSAVIIYDKNIQAIAQLWVLDRLNVYHAWPIISVNQYISFMRENNFTDIRNTGFDTYYFISPTDTVPQRKPQNRTTLGADFENELITYGLKPIRIRNKRGATAFRVYKF